MLHGTSPSRNLSARSEPEQQQFVYIHGEGVNKSFLNQPSTKSDPFLLQMLLTEHHLILFYMHDSSFRRSAIVWHEVASLILNFNICKFDLIIRATNSGHLQQMIQEQ